MNKTKLNIDDYNKLHNLTVSIPQLGQTGFFLTKTVIVTCAHGIELNNIEKNDIIDCMCNEVFYKAKIDYIDYNADVVFATTSQPFENNLFSISSDVLPLDKLYSFGYTEKYKGGESCTIESEGWSRNPYLLKLKMGAIVPGMSGAPLLSLKNKSIVGMIKSSRTFNNKSNITGGRAVPISTIKELYDNQYGSMYNDISVVCKDDLEIVYSICEAAYASTSSLKMDLSLIEHLKKEKKFSEIIKRNDTLRRNSINLWYSLNPACLRFIVTKDESGLHRKGVTCVLPLTENGYMAYKLGEIDEFHLGKEHIIAISEANEIQCSHLCIQSFAFIGKCPRNVKTLLRKSFEFQIMKLASSNSNIHVIAEIGTEAGRKMAEYFNMKMLPNLSYDRRPLYEIILNLNYTITNKKNKECSYDF